MYKIIYFKSFIDVTNFVSNHQELIDTTYHTLYLPWYMEEFQLESSIKPRWSYMPMVAVSNYTQRDRHDIFFYNSFLMMHILIDD